MTSDPAAPEKPVTDKPAPEASAKVDWLAELNIGHYLIGEAIFTGLEAAVRRMRDLMDEAR